MTDKEIIKALECCIANDNKCPDCPIFGSEICGKPALFFKEVFDLINRQQAEIERLRDNNKAIMQTIADVHTEAIKEFVEKMKGVIPEIDDTYIERIVEDYIDNLVKEMVSGDKVQWSKQGECPMTPGQFNAIYDDEMAGEDK